MFTLALIYMWISCAPLLYASPWFMGSNLVAAFILNPGCAQPVASLWSPNILTCDPCGRFGLQPKLTALIACWEPALLIPQTARSGLFYCRRYPVDYILKKSSFIILQIPPHPAGQPLSSSMNAFIKVLSDGNSLGGIIVISQQIS